jgi:hypothetical protein
MPKRRKERGRSIVRDHPSVVAVVIKANTERDVEGGARIDEIERAPLLAAG